MPSSTWNGKFEQVGNGGLAGSIVYSGMAIALGQNYATASTDDGTAGDIPGFLLDPNKVADWRVNAVHETAENAQTIVQGFYGTAPRHAYFTGCSKGGSEASAEMQRFPDDFDGIVGGACAFGGMHNQVEFCLEYCTDQRHGGEYYPATRRGRIDAFAQRGARRLPSGGWGGNGQLP